MVAVMANNHNYIKVSETIMIMILVKIIQNHDNLIIMINGITLTGNTDVENKNNGNIDSYPKSLLKCAACDLRKQSHFQYSFAHLTLGMK